MKISKISIDLPDRMEYTYIQERLGRRSPAIFLLYGVLSETLVFDCFLIMTNDNTNTANTHVDERSDEALVLASQNGDPAALDILCRRYYEHIYNFLINETLIHEASFLEDIRQEIFLKIFKLIRDKEFTPRDTGSFKAYLFTTARNICWNCNYWRNKEPKDIYGKLLELVPARPTPDPDEAAAKDARIKARLARVLAKLSPQEIKLMILLNEGKTYAQIHEILEFAKYSLDYLMLKAYNIRKKLLKLK
jgi:RNA polymerase sigma factor (sigma-70 family)